MEFKIILQACHTLSKGDVYVISYHVVHLPHMKRAATRSHNFSYNTLTVKLWHRVCIIDVKS